jgi:integral membrane sensor domain MASE1
MSKEHSRYRWFVVGVFFFFMLLHQTDKLMIGSLQVQSANFQLNNTIRTINSGAFVAPFLSDLGLFMTVCLQKPIALFICPTWVNGNTAEFSLHAPTGDDSSYRHTLIADYFAQFAREGLWL